MGNKENTRFWEDWRIGPKALKDSYPRIYNICFDKEKSAACMLKKGLDNISFRRSLCGESLMLWGHIRDACESVMLDDSSVRIKWTLCGDGKYNVKTCYRHMIQNEMQYPYKFLWKVKMPPRVKFFVWLLLRKSILTKQNLRERGWQGDTKCSFCGREEDIEHLFVHCSVAKISWMVLKCSFNIHDVPKITNEILVNG